MKKIYSFSEIIEKFFEPLIQKKNITLKALFPITFSSIFNIVSVYIIKEITNKLTNWFQEISFLVIILITLVLLNYIIIYTTKNWTHAVLWPELKKYIYSNYIPKYLYIDNNYIEKQWTWKLMTMIDKWVHSWVDLLNKFLEDVLPSIIMIISSFIFISFINIYYAFALVILFIFTLYFTYILQKKAKSLRIERRELNIALTRRFVKVLMTKFEILQNNKWLEETKNITDSLNKNKKINFKIRNLTVLTGIFTKFIIDWSKIFLIIIFGFWLFWNIINFWEFVALMSIAYILDQILSKFIFLYIDFTNIYDDIEKLWGFFDNAPMIKWYKNWKEFIYKKWDIDIVNLDFKYFKDKIYDNFNLKIGGWKKLAIVWPSWWWKTTLIKILSWYIHQNAGDILIDWQKLSEVSLKSYYKNIWYLTQEPSIFDWTIYENLTYAIYRELGDGELDKILKLSKCDFVHTYEKWLQTEIWERWIRLSWWQKQRLAIAKIMLKNPKIIFLDEPTSAMDSFNEDEVSEALYNLFKWKTVIIIAHRLQTVKHADRIIYIENWEIVEDWTHSELVKIWWKYKKMLDLQSGF